MRCAFILALVALTLGAVACGGSGGGDLSEAFCNDLKSGYSPFQILAAHTRIPSNPNGKYSPEEAADLSYGWAASSCPEELKNNKKLRVYLQNWNIDPDA